jgi:hypothetical protein
MDSVEAVIIAIESLNPGKELHDTEIATYHHVHRVAVARRHQGLLISDAIREENQCAFRVILRLEHSVEILGVAGGTGTVTGTSSSFRDEVGRHGSISLPTSCQRPSSASR